MDQEFELVEENAFGESNQLISSTVIDTMLGEYDNKRKQINDIQQIVDTYTCLGYFVDGYRHKNQNSGYIPDLKSIFVKNHAVGALNAEYWNKILHLTDIYEVMPQKRRDEWHEILRDHKAPDFEESTVRSTINDLLAKRSTFLSERVDGIFRSLSGEHVTNRPEGFSKRMIINYILDRFGYVNSGRAGFINDLRMVVAKFMGRDETEILNNATYKIIEYASKRSGEWFVLDGGALKIRVYKKGTAHLEVHPEMAYRLNQILHHLYPLAIPSEFRTKPKKPSKEWESILKPLSFKVVNALKQCLDNSRYIVSGNRFSLISIAKDKGMTSALHDILISIGGVKCADFMYDFDYNPSDAIMEIIMTGVVPDKKSHQFYPTQDLMAKRAAEMLDAKDGDSVLEPSAGQGDLLKYVDKGTITCVELSKLHSKILETKGYYVANQDFLKFDRSGFDRIIMNPPFSEGRWLAHVKHALSLMKDDGILVSVLPNSAYNSLPKEISGYNIEWSEVFYSEFVGTQINTIIAKITRI